MGRHTDSIPANRNHAWWIIKKTINHFVWLLCFLIAVLYFVFNWKANAHVKLKTTMKISLFFLCYFLKSLLIYLNVIFKIKIHLALTRLVFLNYLSLITKKVSPFKLSVIIFHHIYWNKMVLKIPAESSELQWRLLSFTLWEEIFVKHDAKFLFCFILFHLRQGLNR